MVNGRKAKASLQWPSVAGTVLLSQMVEYSAGETNSSYPSVTYSYVVNGQALQSSRVSFHPSKSEKVVKKYPTGNSVQVFFDPQDPSTAVLETGGYPRIMLAFGIACIVFCCALGLYVGMTN
jgi:hypothetical protein